MYLSQDAISLGILDEHLDELYKLLKYSKNEVINNTVIINNLIYDLCENSSPEKGLCFSDEMFDQINKIKNFNYKYIYLSERLQPSTQHFELIINQIYKTLKEIYESKNIIEKIEEMKKFYPKLMNSFESWIKSYWNLEREDKYKNEVILNIYDEKEYYKAIIYYIAGMTDKYAIEIYNEIIGF